MTRAEMKEEKERKEREFVSSIKGKKIDGKTKGEFRRTSFWKDFRKKLRKERKFDELTGRKLTKTWNCHHVRFEPGLYSDLDERYFMCLNNQQHDLVHTVVSETIKDPGYLDRLNAIVRWHLKVNDGKDVKDFL